MEFSKKMLILHAVITIVLCCVTVIGSMSSKEVSAIAALAGTSFVADGCWGGLYLWKAKNENRSKYAQKFVLKFADKYGIDAALRISEIVLKD